MNSYLSAFGIKATESSNHDLIKRLTALDETDATVADVRFRQYVRAINAAHKKHQFRYARSRPEPFISARAAIEMVRPTVTKIHSLVSEKVYGHPVALPLLPQARW